MTDFFDNYPQVSLNGNHNMTFIDFSPQRDNETVELVKCIKTFFDSPAPTATPILTPT